MLPLNAALIVKTGKCQTVTVDCMLFTVLQHLFQGNYLAYVCESQLNNATGAYQVYGA